MKNDFLRRFERVTRIHVRDLKKKKRKKKEYTLQIYCIRHNSLLSSEIQYYGCVWYIELDYIKN